MNSERGSGARFLPVEECERDLTAQRSTPLMSEVHSQTSHCLEEKGMCERTKGLRRSVRKQWLIRIVFERCSFRKFRAYRKKTAIGLGILNKSTCETRVCRW